MFLIRENTPPFALHHEHFLPFSYPLDRGSPCLYNLLKAFAKGGENRGKKQRVSEKKLRR